MTGTAQTTLSAGVSRVVVMAMSVATGLAVASIYYNQPLLGVLARDLGTTPQGIAIVAVLTQIGYAAGILFLSPLGDRFERRGLILITLLALAAALAATALSNSVATLAAASLATGIFATAAQQIVPMAVQLAAPATRGKTLGTVMAGLLLGILLARTASGLVAGWLGWHAVYWIAAVLILVCAALLRVILPQVRPTTALSYGNIMGSLWHLLRTHRTLRRAALLQGALFAAFVAFWSNLALMMQNPPYGMGASEAGLMGLVGAAGALAAPLAGRAADRTGPAKVSAGACVLVLLSFLSFWAVQGSLIALILGVLVMDFGVQASMVSNQARIFALDPVSRSRINTVFMTALFTGGAIGAWLSSLAFSAFGWSGTSLFAAACGLLAVVVAVLEMRRTRIS